MAQSSSAGGLSKNRVETLVDGVFAIAMTLLVFNIKVPELPGAGKDPNLNRRLLALWPQFTGYAITFVMLAIYWVGHHNQFHFIRRVDRSLLWLNILFLMTISFLPFSTALLGSYPNRQTCLVIYGCNLIANGGALYWHWAYATTRHRLVDPEIDGGLVTMAKLRILFSPAICLIAIGLSFLSWPLALGLYAIIPLFYVAPGRIDRHWAKM